MTVKERDVRVDSNLVLRQKLFEVADTRDNLLEFQAEMIPPKAPLEWTDLKELRLEGKKDKI